MAVLGAGLVQLSMPWHSGYLRHLSYDDTNTPSLAMRSLRARTMSVIPTPPGAQHRAWCTSDTQWPLALHCRRKMLCLQLQRQLPHDSKGSSSFQTCARVPIPHSSRHIHVVLSSPMIPHRFLFTKWAWEWPHSQLP